MWRNAVTLMRNEATSWFNTLTPWAVELNSLFLRWGLLCLVRLADCNCSQTFRLPFWAFSLSAIDSLTFESLAITLCTTNFDIQKFYAVITLRLWVVYGLQNKQRLLSHTTSADLFCITEVESIKILYYKSQTTKYYVECRINGYMFRAFLFN